MVSVNEPSLYLDDAEGIQPSSTNSLSRINSVKRINPVLKRQLVNSLPGFSAGTVEHLMLNTAKIDTSKLEGNKETPTIENMHQLVNASVQTLEKIVGNMPQAESIFELFNTDFRIQ
jgi:hypothetical protein